MSFVTFMNLRINEWRAAVGRRGVFARVLVMIAAGTAPVMLGAAEVDFNRDIRPILSNACFKCHGPDGNTREGGSKKTGGLRLDTAAGAAMDLDGYQAIVPGDSKASVLIDRVLADDVDDVMPPPKSGHRLTAEQVRLLSQWIDDGANYQAHWSYVKPVRPKLKKWFWSKSGVDQLIHARLAEEGLTPAPEASRATLIRRLSLDITGLPPTVENVAAFEKTGDRKAYERVVDRLLASDAYGEHWARKWLDLARYADSAGYADDPPRTIWAYRDYVIRSLNANKPFNQFTLEQIAGDLLPSPTEEQLVATGFNRNTLTNNEGGTNDEEYRNVAIVDRVNTTMATWMGTTADCAQCHDHKFDPISQKEYFQLFAIFNSTEDSDRKNESPTHSIYAEGVLDTRVELEREISELEASDKNASVKSDPKVLAALKAKLKEAKPITTVPVMKELAEARETRIQIRGNYLATGEAVQPGLPAAFYAADGEEVTRLTLAKWLVSPDNPLTSRVVANRLWEQVFGIGIVSTSEEFGAQGELPVHPELLDWLAVEFVESGWDMKALLKTIVMTSTYRQQSGVTPEMVERDPTNRLLARGARFRLSAEQIRDQALKAGSLLSPKMYGPPVRPPQPIMGVKAAFGGSIDWKTSEGEDRFRRGLYTNWRRSNPYPSMVTFDATNREVCTVQRDRTNTPLQALVTLNDPVFVEAAQGLGRRMAGMEGVLREKLSFGFRVCVARSPEASELDRLVALYEGSLARLAEDSASATSLATEPIGALPAGAVAAEYAAWTVVGNVLLNLDEVLMRR